MKKAIVQIATAILGTGNTFDEAMADAQAIHPDLVDSDIVSRRGAQAGDCVCVDMDDELAIDAL